MPSYLIQILLPLVDPAGRPFAENDLAAVRRELTDRFGGMTAYTRAPAEGTWQNPSGRTERDDVVIVEVMSDSLDREWWHQYAKTMAATFQQDAVVIRAIAIEQLGT